jgi:hypothetical protein
MWELPAFNQMQDVLAVEDFVTILLISLGLIRFFLCYLYKKKTEK